MYQYNRQEIETAIELLADAYPKCFFLDPAQRRPIKKNIVSDLIKDGVALAPELLSAAISWYTSHFGYQLTLEAGVKRIDAHGKEVSPVTEQEHRVAQKYVHDRKLERQQEERERKQQQTANVIVNRIAKTPASNLPINNPSISTKEIPMPMKTVKPDDDLLAPIQTLLNAVRSAFEQPEALRRPFAIAGLRVVVMETNKLIQAMEEESKSQ